MYTAVWNFRNVIVKVIKRENQDVESIRAEFETEISILLRVNHPNIIRILGHGIQKGRIFLVLEPLSEVGSNINSLHSLSNKSQLFRRGLQISLQLCNALAYLNHGIHPSITIIHRDLKIENLGIGSDNQLKLFDFGLAKCLRNLSHSDEPYNMTGGTGTLRYMAPEVAQYKPYNEKADVYSFAILVWAIVTKQVPFRGLNKETHFERIVLGGERPPLHDNWPNWFQNLLKDAWNGNPSLRPGMQEIQQILESHIYDDGDVNSISLGSITNTMRVPNNENTHIISRIICCLV